MFARFKKTIHAVLSRMRRDNVQKASLINVARDWTIIFIAAVLINVINIGAHIYILIDAGSTSVYTDVQASDVRTIDRSELKEVLRTYEQKQVRFNSLLEDPPNTVDPAQ